MAAMVARAAAGAAGGIIAVAVAAARAGATNRAAIRAARAIPAVRAAPAIRAARAAHVARAAPATVDLRPATTPAISLKKHRCEMSEGNAMRQATAAKLGSDRMNRCRAPSIARPVTTKIGMPARDATMKIGILARAELIRETLAIPATREILAIPETRVRMRNRAASTMSPARSMMSRAPSMMTPLVTATARRPNVATIPRNQTDRAIAARIKKARKVEREYLRWA
jgi:hypothetical protein